MRRKLNDTSALTRLGDEGEYSMSVRKIENGFITRESVCDAKGYRCSETFSERAPNIRSAKDAAGSEGGGATMRYLNEE
jgi:hypothetical protein